MDKSILLKIVDFWQHIPESINPVFFKIGPVYIYYYGLMYLTAILVVYFLSLNRLKNENFSFSYSKATIENFFVWVIIGVLAGSRLGYVFFYNFGYYLKHPLEMLFPFSFNGGFHYIGISGMSYHGGLLGAIIAGAIFCRKFSIDFWNFSDFFLPLVPLGYTFGRIGNFINGELYGRPTEVFWGMYFPTDSTNLLRHPSQLYEAFFEGVLIFVVLWSIRKKSFSSGCMLAFYIFAYGFVRFFIEFYREPDPQLGLILGPFTMGQIFCFLMIIGGAVLCISRHRQKI